MSKSLRVEIKDNSVEDKEADAPSITDDVRQAEYYYGFIPRTDIEPLLRKEGDFILRKTEQQPGQVVLAVSVFWDGTVRHYMINQDEQGLYIEGHHEKTVGELIQWHRSSRTALNTTTGAKLRRAVERPPWLLNHESIKLAEKLGEGAFGEVYLAEFKEEEVAVKTMRGEATGDDRRKFMKEARTMRKFKHRNVVKILGVAVHELPLMIVMEFCPGGSLLSYVRKKPSLFQRNSGKFIFEASDGLAYLERERCIHRDIAARNCLLTAKQDVKISDFGMSEETAITEDKLEKVPVKWLAPETLQQRKYSHKTDVWSYGILCWEVYADGAEPYPGLTNLQTRAKIVVQNYRMEMSKDTPTAVAELVHSCWDKDPEKRPSFTQIARTLKDLRERSSMSSDRDN
ncbi:TK/FER protein kinase [Aphelenchoides avenae]|nr:TK/FER protein kinase [Aphelenchus avenae]